MRLLRGLPVLLAVLISAPAIFSQDPTPQRIRVGGEVQQARITKYVPPAYPPLARQARIEGTVRFRVILAVDGGVSQAEVVSGHPLLVQAALDAVRQWQYQPTLLNGVAIEVSTTADVVFNLNDDAADAAADADPQAVVLQRVQELLRNGKTEEALAEARATVSQNPDYHQVRAILPRVLRMAGRRPEAIQSSRELVQREPDDPDLRQQLLTLLLEEEVVHDAITEFYALRRLREPAPTLCAQLGLALYRIRNPESAAAEFRVLVQNHPDVPMVHLNLAENLIFAGRLDAALRHANEAMQMEPDAERVKTTHQRIAQVRDFLDQGMLFLHRKLQQEPNRPEIRAWLALGLFARGEWESAGREEYASALAQGFDEPDAHSLLARGLQNRSGKQQGITEIRNFACRFPSRANLRAVLAGLLLDIGDRETALAELRNAVAAAPADASLREQLAQFLERMGDADGARAERQMAASLPPPSAHSAFRDLAMELEGSLAPRPSQNSSPEIANETAAIGAVRTINTAAVMYSSTYSGFPPSLASLGPVAGPAAEPTALQADLIDSVLASGSKGGYLFTYIAGPVDREGRVASYEIYADPAQPGVTGNRYFFSDQSGVIRVSTGGRASAASPPLQ